MEGREAVKRRLLSLGDQVTDGVRQAIRGSALAVETEAKRAVKSGGKSGRVYEKYNPRRTHRASSPGEAPATDTGYLWGHITTVLDADGLGANVESRAAYSKALEFGTVKMGARPFLFPAFERLKPKISKVIGDAIKKARSA